MPTAKPRVQVILEPQTHAVIERLAILQGRSRGAVIADLIDSVAPSLTRTVSLLEAAQAAPESVKAGLRSVVEGVHQELVGVAGDASKQLDFLLDKLTAQPAGGESGAATTPQANPHVVTRGSGLNPLPQKSAAPRKRKGSRTGDSDNA